MKSYLFKAKGEGGGKIFIPHDQQNSNLDVVLNSGEIFASTTSQLKNKEKWILGGIGLAFIALFIIIFSVFKSKKSKKDKNDSPNKSKSLKRNSGQKENRNTNMGGDDIDDVESNTFFGYDWCWIKKKFIKSKIVICRQIKSLFVESNDFRHCALMFSAHVLCGRAQFPLFDVSVRRSTHGDVERFRAYY